jgi:hypothetical protein
MHACPSELCSWPPVRWFHMSPEVTTTGRPYCTPVRVAAIRGSHFHVVPYPPVRLSRLCIGKCRRRHRYTHVADNLMEGSRDEDRSRREDHTCHIVDRPLGTLEICGMGLYMDHFQ